MPSTARAPVASTRIRPLQLLGLLHLGHIGGHLVHDPPVALQQVAQGEARVERHVVGVVDLVAGERRGHRVHQAARVRGGHHQHAPRSGERVQPVEEVAAVVEVFDDLARDDHLGGFDAERLDGPGIGAVDLVGLVATTDRLGHAELVQIQSDQLGGDPVQVGVQPAVELVVVLPAAAVDETDVHRPSPAGCVQEVLHPVHESGRREPVRHVLLGDGAGLHACRARFRCGWIGRHRG